MDPANAFTVEALLAAPRRSAAVPNGKGTLALYTIATHSFNEQKTTKELRLMKLETGLSEKLSDDSTVHDAVWIPGTDDIMYLGSGEQGLTQVFVIDGADNSKERYQAAEISAPVGNLKLKQLENGCVAFIVTGLVGDDGSLHNEEAAEKPLSSGRVFDTTYVQTWDSWYKDRRYALWYNQLVLSDGKWKLNGELHNTVKNAPLEAPFGMYDTFDPLNNFDICSKGIGFVARDLTRTAPEVEYVSFPYFLPLDSFSSAPTQEPYLIPLPADFGPGAGTNVKISPDASTFGFLHEDNNDPCNIQLFMSSIGRDGKFGEPTRVDEAQDAGFDPPSRFEFADSAKSVIIERQQKGRVALASLQLVEGEKPQVFLTSGAVSAFHPVEEGAYDTLLVSSSSFLESSLWQIVSVSGKKATSVVSSLTENGASWGLSPEMVTDFWYEGDGGVQVHCFMMLPPGFDKTVCYPWILLPHGGPEAAWIDAWSTRWNLAFFAAQGYVVICPNIAGSTGYGIGFLRRVHNEWAGTAFRDMLRLMSHLETLPWLDQHKAVVVGGSYSAYLLSWMMGDDIIKKFCGAVWHSGRFSLPSSLIQADTPKWDAAFGGSSFFWENEAGIERANPAAASRLRNWVHAPPTLVCHGQRDYRCAWGDGLATFKTLQKLGVRSRFLTFPDEGHWILGRENARLWLKTITEWARKCVDGEITRSSENPQVI